MSKAATAFRTISEVAEILDVPKHVLRFWEQKFPQIKPMKRGGGRRYYRPEDLELLRGIRHLLHADGYTIKGVQKILREKGIEDVKLAAPEVAKARGEAAVETEEPVSAPPPPAEQKKATPVRRAATKSAGKSSTTRGRAGRTAAVAEVSRIGPTIEKAIRELEQCRDLLRKSCGSGTVVASSRRQTAALARKRAARS